LDQDPVQQRLQMCGHAIECRINAEHAWRFTPSPGVVRDWLAPGGPGIRVESHLYAGYEVPPHYDSLVAKLLAHGADREQAIARMRVALEELVIEGIDTNVALHQDLMREPGFVRGGFDIHHLEHYLAGRVGQEARA
jgi:acetyl-CoA carboxylase biotin carboxylase subunit